MKKRMVLIVVLLLAAIGMYFGVKAFRDAYLAIPIPPDPDWEPYVSSLDAQREKFFVEREGLKLEAELFIPNNGRDKKPAVVFVVGSGDSLYQNYAPGLIEKYIFEVFLPRDMAVLLINKRAMGLSEGDYTRNSIEGRAEDIYAGVRHIQSHPAIDADRIGLVGHSQGGWVVTRAAAEHPDVAFFISLAGPTTTIEENAIDNATNYAICQGMDDEERAAYLEKRARQRNLSIWIGERTDFGMFGFDARVMGYDPKDALLKIESPGLFVYAENDALVTPKLSIDRLDAILAGEPKENFTVIVIDDATHSFRVVDEVCDSYESLEGKALSSQLSEEMNNWLESQGF